MRQQQNYKCDYWECPAKHISSLNSAVKLHIRPCTNSGSLIHTLIGAFTLYLKENSSMYFGLSNFGTRENYSKSNFFLVLLNRLILKQKDRILIQFRPGKCIIIH